MLAQILAPLFAGGGGVIIGLFKAYLQYKNGEKESEKRYLHEERLSQNNQLLEWGKLQNEIKEHWIYYLRNISNNGLVWMCCLTYCYICAIYAENSSDIIWTFAPENAKDHWSILFGLATWQQENPEIVAVTKGGVAFWMGQPLISIVSATITGSLTPVRR